MSDHEPWSKHMVLANTLGTILGAISGFAALGISLLVLLRG